MQGRFWAPGRGPPSWGFAPSPVCSEGGFTHSTSLIKLDPSHLVLPVTQNRHQPGAAWGWRRWSALTARHRLPSWLVLPSHPGRLNSSLTNSQHSHLVEAPRPQAFARGN